MFQKIELRKTRDFSAKINITFEFIRENFRILAKSMIYISGPFILIGGICAGLYQQKSLSGLGQGIFGNVFNEWYGVMIIFILLGNISTMIVVNEFVRLYELKDDPQTIEVSEIWEGVKENFIRILLAMFVVTFLLIVSFIILILPFFYVGTVLSLVAPIMIIEKKNFGDAFSRCFYLISEKWWSTFGILVVTVLIAGFMGYIFQLPQLVFTVVFTLHKTSDSMAEPPLWEQAGILVSSVISTVGSNLLQSIIFVAMIFQFYNLVERKEAQGLLNRLDSFGKTDVNAPRHDETY